jgi:hypothetical protein
MIKPVNTLLDDGIRLLYAIISEKTNKRITLFDKAVVKLYDILGIKSRYCNAPGNYTNKLGS